MPAPTTEQRATVYAALGDPLRLRIADELAASDRSPGELAEWLEIPTNLLAHHLSVLERAGLIERVVSSGDARRRYVRLLPGAVQGKRESPARPGGAALFVCSHNSARSKLASAVWEHRGLGEARSAGTDPASRVHPGAVAAAARAGLKIRDAIPRRLDLASALPPIVVTVCDRAHEEIPAARRWLHWSIPDPVESTDPAAFDHVLASIERRIAQLLGTQPPNEGKGPDDEQR